MIQIENINVSYQQTLALDNITLNLEGPSITGIIGPNGAGKSTLIKALIGIIPHSGKILFNKQPIRQQFPMLHRRLILILTFRLLSESASL